MVPVRRLIGFYPPHPHPRQCSRLRRAAGGVGAVHFPAGACGKPDWSPASLAPSVPRPPYPPVPQRPTSLRTGSARDFEAVRGRADEAMVNVVLCRVLCHNACVVTSRWASLASIRSSGRMRPGRTRTYCRWSGRGDEQWQVFRDSPTRLRSPDPGRLKSTGRMAGYGSSPSGSSSPSCWSGLLTWAYSSGSPGCFSPGSLLPGRGRQPTTIYECGSCEEDDGCGCWPLSRRELGWRFTP
jgi:hypothetical protein